MSGAPLADDIARSRRHAGDWLLARAGHAPGDVPALGLLREEGVVGMAHARALAIADDVPRAWREELAALAREAAVRHLCATAAAQRLQQVLDREGIPALWLKGVALAQWLYASPHHRDVADLDLLVPERASALRLARAAADAGIELPNPHVAGDLVTHQLTAIDRRAGLELDLHWDVGNAAVFAGRLPWQDLVATARPLPMLGGTARGLGGVHALLHACLHRAANRLGGRHDRLRWLMDIHLLASRFDAGDWEAWVERARVYRIADHCRDALAASRRILRTEPPAWVDAALEAAARLEDVETGRLGDWWYVQRCNWRALPGMPMRLRWLRQSLLPDVAHLRVRYGADGARLPVVVLRRLGDAWRRWRGWARPRDSL